MRLRKFIGLFLIITVLLAAAGCSGNTGRPANEQKVPAAGTADSAKNELFASVSWLKENLKNVVILDARTDKEYNDGHIPGAINAMWQGFAEMKGNPGDTGWGVLLPKDKLAEKIGALGINQDKMVVVYADPNAWGEDGRILWTLRIAGLTNCKLLDGGWPAWKAANGETTKDMSKPVPVEFKIAAMDDGLNVTTDWVKANLGKAKIVDSRSPKEYGGATDFGEKRGGHIPNAINIPYKEVFNDDGTVKSTQQLKELFTKAGLKPEDEIAAYCTKGIRSAHMSLLLRMAGFTKARNYDASYYEWAGNAALSVEK